MRIRSLLFFSFAFSMTFSIIWTTSGCGHQKSTQPPQVHPIAIEQVHPIAEGLIVTLVGKVGILSNHTPRDSAANYDVTVQLPEGAHAKLAIGQMTEVMLPILHNQRTSARVYSIEGSQIHFHLEKQMQELNRQEVKVKIPLVSSGIFRIPFEAVYCPRGLEKSVFIVQGHRIIAQSVQTIALEDSAEILVAGKLSPNDSVAVRGIDGLISGDSVQILTKEGLNK